MCRERGKAVPELMDGHALHSGFCASAIHGSVQRLLFGKPLTAAAGLTDTPALILQGSEDKEVTPDGCALYAHRAELAGAPVTFRLIDDPQSSGHMTVIRKAGSRCVNADTMQTVDAFLGARIPEAAPQEDI